MAYLLEKAEHCQMCGTAEWEWDPELGGNKFAYEAVEKLCQGCLRIAVQNENINGRQGVTAILVATDTVEHAKRKQKAKSRWQEQMVARSRKAQNDSTG